MSFLTRKWSDAEKWGMGIMASLVIAATLGVWQILFADVPSPTTGSTNKCESGDVTINGQNNTVIGNCNNNLSSSDK